MEDSVNDERKLKEAIKLAKRGKVMKLDNTTKLDNTNEDVAEEVLEALILILRELRLSKKYNERSAKNLAFVSWIYIISFVVSLLSIASMSIASIR